MTACLTTRMSGLWIAHGQLAGQPPARPSKTAGQIRAGHLLGVGIGVLVVVAGVFAEWMTATERGRYFARTHDRFLRRQREQVLTSGQECVLWIFGVACSALFILGGVVLIVIAIVFDLTSDWRCPIVVNTTVRRSAGEGSVLVRGGPVRARRDDLFGVGVR